MPMPKKDNDDLQVKLATLVDENEKRLAQVQKWNDTITELRGAIAKAKEDHDFTRGKITALEELVFNDD